MSKQIALIIMFFILGILLLFHFLILTELIPYHIVWAGKLSSVEEMRVFEIISISLNTFMLSVLYLKYRQLARGIRNEIIDILIWIFAGFFALNTVGNLFSKSITELVIGTFLTLTSSILCLVIAQNKK